MCTVIQCLAMFCNVNYEVYGHFRFYHNLQYSIVIILAVALFCDVAYLIEAYIN